MREKSQGSGEDGGWEEDIRAAKQGPRADKEAGEALRGRPRQVSILRIDIT